LGVNDGGPGGDLVVLRQSSSSIGCVVELIFFVSMYEGAIFGICVSLCAFARNVVDWFVLHVCSGQHSFAQSAFCQKEIRLSS
jgi:hypothetical protein